MTICSYPNLVVVSYSKINGIPLVLLYTGLPLPLYGTGASCGGCVQVWCVDSICKNTLVANATFMITDSCHDCQGNSLVISAAGVRSLFMHIMIEIILNSCKKINRN